MEPLKATLEQLAMEWFFEIILDAFLPLERVPLDHTTNNAAELWGLIKGLHLAVDHNFTKLIVEGDSLLIISLLHRLVNGAKPDNISPSWRLSHGLQIIAGLLNPNLVVIPTHVRRKANQIADELANLGVTWTGSDLQCNAEQDLDHPIFQQCVRKASLVDVPPDGVIVRATRRSWEWAVATRTRGHVKGPCHPPLIY
jgi:ribonuclease HI